MSINGNSSEKVLISAYLIIALFFILTIRIWQLQILQGSEYRKLSEENRLRIVRVAAPRGIIFDRNGIPLVKNTPYYFVSISPQNLDGLDISALAELLKMDKDVLSEKVKNRPQQNLYEPIRLKEGLSTKEIALIEARRSDFPSLAVDVDVSRDYLFGSTGAHLIGYLGKPNEFQYSSPDFRDVPSNAFIGQWGVEKLYDRQLRGTSGERIIEMDALGRELRLIKEKSPVRGDDVKLAMDIKLQKEAEESFGEKTGALVAMKPDTGEILAMVSKPSFDPNLFARGIKYRQWEELNQNKKLPLLNRSLQSQYPPGSTFKIITAIAAIEEGAIDVNTKVTCTGEIVYGKWHFGCWQKHGHGTLSLHRALVESCDVYFYDLGKRLGIDKIASYARMFGLGKETGLRIAKERSGMVPDTKWKQEKRKQPWYLGETFNASIGQGYVATTPFQMAQMMSIVANGGYIYSPSLLMADNKPAPLTKLNIRQETFDEVKKALSGVVNENGGTGWAAKSSMVNICGKTGTAQVVGMKRDSKYLPEMFRDHAWFVAFAPYEAPEIALSVMMEHGGHGGAAAAPIAKRAIEVYMKGQRLENRQTTH
ncbi:MAG TPA: penicillin-binding protein 2 [Thermodesulfovibrionales bacterium]|nr:penicillin-binding protein 2 [Thermodesulfovibrionales bacterium]